MVNWDAVGAIAELAGATGVIITLLYLSIQLRQNTKASRITAIQSSMETSAQFSELLLSDEEVARVFWLGMSDPAALDGVEKRKYMMTLNVFMRRECAAFYLHKEGVMPDHLWNSRVASLTGTLNQPGMKFYLEATGDTIPGDFREFLGEVVKSDSTLNEKAKSLFFERDA